MRVVTVTNQKGGVGKTVLACHLAFASQEAGQRTLLIDLDTQANATATLTGSHALLSGGGSASLFTGNGVRPAQTPSGIGLLGGHQELDALDAQFRLEQAVPVRERLRSLPYDLVVIDTPPAIGLRHVGPILWCDVCVTPLEPNSYSVAGLAHTLGALRLARRLNPALQHVALINRHIRRSKQQTRYIEELRRHVPLKQPYLPLRVAVADALDRGVPVWRFPRATRDTRDLWRNLCVDLAA